MRDHEVRAAALKKLVERRIKEGERVAAGREQKQTDELAARAAWVRFAEANARGAI